jgi:hypothetical protein
MPANAGLPDNPQRISAVCACGKKLVANSMLSGKRLKCPSCGQVVVFPPARAGIVAAPPIAASKPPIKAGNRGLMIVLWSLPILALIGAGASIYFHEQSRQQARIDAANTEVKEATKGADGWLKQGSARDGENVEDRLMKAIAANDVSEKANADAVLERVRTRRAELAADALFDSAKTKLDAKAIVEAVALLHRYVAERHATKKPEASQLLADYDLATSDSAALETLKAMSDEQFVQYRNTGKLDDRKITHPVLVESRASTLRRNLGTENQRRAEIKIAEANRQKAERLAVETARRAAEDAKEQAAIDAVKLIYTRIVGSWRWGQPDSVQTIRFAKDGTYVLRAPWGIASRGLWKVDKDGTIPVSDDKNFSVVVRMKLKEDKISIADGVTEVVASRSTESGMTAAEILLYVAQQLRDIKKHRGDPELRRQAADNLKELGPEAVAAVPELANVVLEDADTEVKRTAMEALGEIGMPKGMWYVRNPVPGGQVLTIYAYDSSGNVSYAGHPAIGALVHTLLRTEDPQLGVVAEDALVKLLPTIRKRLTMDDAILLREVQASGNKRLAPAIDSALAIFAVAQEAIAKEADKRRLQAQRDAEYWAKEGEKRRLAGKPSLEELTAGARARREEMFRGPPQPSPFGPPVPWREERQSSNVPVRRNQERQDRKGTVGTAAGTQGGGAAPPK